jgi:hypothetical protein
MFTRFVRHEEAPPGDRPNEGQPAKHLGGCDNEDLNFGLSVSVVCRYLSSWTDLGFWLWSRKSPTLLKTKSLYDIALETCIPTNQKIRDEERHRYHAAVCESQTILPVYEIMVGGRRRSTVFDMDSRM